MALSKKRVSDFVETVDEFDITNEELEDFIVEERRRKVTKKKRLTGHDYAILVRYIFGKDWRPKVIAALESDHHEHPSFGRARPRLVSSDTWEMSTPREQKQKLQRMRRPRKTKKRERIKVDRSKRVGT